MTRRKRLAYALLAYLMGAACLLMPRCGRAEEPVKAPPCRDEGAVVVCEAEAFGRLVIKLRDSQAAVAQLRLALEDCQTRPTPITTPVVLPPAPLPPEQPSRVRPTTALVLGTVSGAALMAGAAMELSGRDRAGLLTAGLVGLGVATLIATW